MHMEDGCAHWFHCSFSETVPKAVPKQSESQGDTLQVFHVDTHTSKQLRHFKFLSVSFLSQLLASSHFIRKVVCSFSMFVIQ